MQLDLMRMVQAMLPMLAIHTALPQEAHIMAPVALPLARMMDCCMFLSDTSAPLQIWLLVR
jgi:hypothetical protein